MKVLFLNPPFKPEFGRFSREQRSPAITKGGTLYYPTWLCYAAGLLEKYGFEVKIIDAPARRYDSETVFRLVREWAPTMLVLGTSTPSIQSDVRFAEEIKRSCPIFIVAVGPHPSAVPEETLKLSTALDAVARKEYEYTLLELARVLKNTKTPDKAILEGIQGISWQWGGGVAHNPDRPFIEGLDDIPFVSEVYKNHLEITDYFYTIAQYPQVAIFSGRGCPHRCFYCVYPQTMHGRRYRPRSVANIIAEFSFIQTRIPEVREIFIEDDTFTIDRKRVQEFCRAYLTAGLSISWIANSRADIDLETLQSMKRANCRLLCVGFESGDQRVLDGMRKNLKIAAARQFTRDARRAGILLHGCFLFGSPEETRESMRRTLDFAKRLELDTAQFFPLMVYPGTEAFEWADRNGYLRTGDYSDWTTPEGLHNCQVDRPGLSSHDLVRFCNHARREFYLRPRYLAYRLKRLLLHPLEDGPRMLKSLGTFWKHLLAGTT